MQTHSTPSGSRGVPPWMLTEQVFTATAQGHVGTGRTREDARRDLMEKIRHSGEM